MGVGPIKRKISAWAPGWEALVPIHTENRSAREIPQCPAKNDPRDEIAMDVLELWIRISRLLEKVTHVPDQKPKKPSASKKLRRQAA
jgi:hypothetical protein